MGQRLVIDINKDRKTLASVYFHWSAYTDATFAELIKLRDILLNGGLPESPAEIQKKLIHGLVPYGGGLDPEEDPEQGKALLGESFPVALDHSQGMVSITQKGIEEAETWSEVTPSCLDLDTLIAENNTYFYRPFDPYEYRPAGKIPMKDLPELTPFTEKRMWNIPLRELEERRAEVRKLPREGICCEVYHHSGWSEADTYVFEKIE